MHFNLIDLEVLSRQILSIQRSHAHCSRTRRTVALTCERDSISSGISILCRHARSEVSCIQTLGG